MTTAPPREIVHHRGHPVVRRVLKTCVAGLCKAVMRVEVRGREHVPRRGPLIVAANHLHNCDALLLGAHLPWPVETLAVSDLFRVPITGQFLRLYGVIPVYRGGTDRSTMRAALAALARGEVVSILPEGRISKTGGLERARTGVAYLALTAGVPVLPVAFTGTERALDGLRRFRRGRVTMTIGEPIAFGREVVTFPDERGRLREVADGVMTRIAALLPPAYRGVYADAAAAADRPDA